MSSRNALGNDTENGCVADYILACKRDNRHGSTTGQVIKEPAGEFRSGENKLSDVRSFINWGSQEGLTSFNKPNRANFSCKKKQQSNKNRQKKNHLCGETFRGV